MRPREPTTFGGFTNSRPSCRRCNRDREHTGQVHGGRHGSGAHQLCRLWGCQTEEAGETDEVEAEAARLQKEWEDAEYQRLRAPEYPDVKEYLDGLVKGDTDQMQGYIDKCLAVKAKYPKPE